MSKKIRITIDIIMTVMLPLLMAYSLIGETFHEVVGTVIFVLFIIHHILNRKWYGAWAGALASSKHADEKHGEDSTETSDRGSVEEPDGDFDKISSRGSYRKRKSNARIIFQMTLDLLLLIFMILQPVSGILISRHLYTFLPALPISSLARSIHMMLAYWGYVLLSIHAGTHLVPLMRKLALKGKNIFTAVCVVLGSISLYGIIAFIQRGFPGYMSGKTAFAFFDFSEPRIFFFLDYLSIMILFMLLGCLVTYGLTRRR